MPLPFIATPSNALAITLAFITVGDLSFMLFSVSLSLLLILNVRSLALLFLIVAECTVTSFVVFTVPVSIVSILPFIVLILESNCFCIFLFSSITPATDSGCPVASL